VYGGMIHIFLKSPVGTTLTPIISRRGLKERDLVQNLKKWR